MTLRVVTLIDRSAPVCFVGCVLVISWLAFSASPPDTLSTGWDKLNHVLAFAVLAFWLWRTSWVRNTLAQSGVLIAYGLFVEGVQGVLGYREMAWNDVVADACGLAAFHGLKVICLQRLLREPTPAASPAPPGALTGADRRDSPPA